MTTREQHNLRRQKVRLATWLWHQYGTRPEERIRADKRYQRLLSVIGKLRQQREFADCPTRAEGEMGL